LDAAFIYSVRGRNAGITVPISVGGDWYFLTVISECGGTVPNLRMSRGDDVELLNLDSVLFPTGVLPTDSFATSVIVATSNPYPS
tara:strand:- start:70 stop:324 length:255 start_codon:yes stop_codon:yes gene_type:complete